MSGAGLIALAGEQLSAAKPGLGAATLPVEHFLNGTVPACYR